MIDVKTQRWIEVGKQIAGMTDAAGLPVDAGIRETVAALQVLGIHTTASCEGHAERGSFAPWVEIAAPEMRPREKQAFVAQQRAEQARAKDMPQEESRKLMNEAERLQTEVRAAHLQVCARLAVYLARFYLLYPLEYDRHLVINFSDWLGRGRLQSQGTRFQELRMPDERRLRLTVYQQEMQTFAAFLKQVYFAEDEGRM